MVTVLILIGLFAFVYLTAKILYSKECKECKEQEQKDKYKECTCEGTGCICGLKE